MDKLLTVFVCSTFDDLAGEREAVLDAIRRVQLMHDSMEFFGARGDRAIETCLDEVRRSDVLVVIVGHRYGTLVPGLGVSYSEAEYSEAYRLGKPCLVYLRDENVPILPRHVERDPENFRLLEKWKATLQERHTVAMFRDGNKLAVQVAADLNRTLQDVESTARTPISGDPKRSGSVREEIETLVFSALTSGVSETSLLAAVRESVSSLLRETHRRPKFLMSYANSDLATVREVVTGLERAGMSVSLLAVGSKSRARLMPAIERSLASADFFVFFISPKSVRSQWVTRELSVLLYQQMRGERGPTILPVLLADADVPPLIRQYRWIDMRDGDADLAVTKLVSEIRQHSLRRLERR